MAPNPAKFIPNDEELSLKKPESALSGDEIVISGIAGIFPKCASVEEFENNLYNKVDMVTRDEKPEYIHPEMPLHHGKAQGFDKFDAQFLRVPHGQAEVMDPMIRKLLENVYCALFDAEKAGSFSKIDRNQNYGNDVHLKGVNPSTLAGTKLGVFVGSSFNEIINVNLYNLSRDSNYLITGCSKTMQANRISYWLDGKGPSVAIDMACSSSMVALEEAHKAVRNGQCDSAIVAGCNLLIDPMLSYTMRRAGLLCLDGKTKSFDRNADGYVRSEAVPVFFLQRAHEAKRIYAEVIHVKHNYTMKPDVNFLPIQKSNDIEELLRQFYLEVGISPDDVEYVEACGSGLAEGDANELEAINRIFANGKSIKIGSVKSNMGHSEGAADACSVIKACLAYHKGELPGNLHYNVPQDDIAGVRDGKIQVLTENTAFKRGYTALNSFSFTGTNYHALMKGHYKKKKLDCYNSTIPRLILASGRTDNSVLKIFDTLKSQPIDAEQIALLHDFFAKDISGHTFRGYALLETNENKETTSLTQHVCHNPGVTNPVWFLYSGMGSQWAGMGAELIKIPRFAASIDRCRKVLEPKGIDIVKIITDKDKKIFDNILHAFVGIGAMQIALTDLLSDMGIVPDNIIGHSVGEHGCAYADGCFTAEEMMLVSYYRGLISLETKTIKGMMAAVSLGYEEVSLLCPPEIEVACHNSPTSSTISGPAEIVEKFVEDLTSRGIFAKGVQTANIAYHSRYIAEAGPRLLSTINELIKVPKLRSEKWLCTSAPPEKWDHEDVKYASAKYFTNNLLSSVYFYEAAKNIPENAIIVEVSPHGLMQAILRRSHSACTNIPLTKQNNPNPINFLLEAIGKLYEAGLNPKIDFLYPKVQYPVSTETPILSSLVGWAHDSGWELAVCQRQQASRKSSRTFAMTLSNDDWKYIQGHVRNGAVIFPESAFLVLVWETLAMKLGLHYTDTSVKFEKIRFHKELFLKKDEIVRFTIGIQGGNSEFEVYQDKVPIVSGFVYIFKRQHENIFDENYAIEDDVTLTATDIYMLLDMKGYSYKGDFQSILSMNTKCNKASVKCTNEWITLLDSLIQFNILSKNHEGVSIPKYITSLSIDTTLHKITERILVDNVVGINAVYNNYSGITRCGGVKIKDLKFYDKPKINKMPHIDNLSFVPHIGSDVLSVQNALKINFQIITENVPEKHLNIVELIMDSNKDTLSYEIKNIIEEFSTIKLKLNYIQIKSKEIEEFITRNQELDPVNVYIINGFERDNQKFADYIDALKQNINTYVLTIQPVNSPVNIGGTLITCLKFETQKIMMFKGSVSKSITRYIVVDEKDNYSWVPQVKNKLNKGEKVVLVSEKYHCGLISFVKNLIKEGFNKIRLVMVTDSITKKFSAKNPFYEEQIEKDLAFNIFKKGHWGGYYYLPADNHIVDNINMVLTSIDSSDNWAWVEKPLHTISNKNIQVSYAGLSLYDYQNSIGKINGNISFGMDFSGYNHRGDRVMGLVSGGALASTVEADSTLVWPVPEHWTMEDAATVPVHYALAYYCLAIRGNMHRNETVMVVGGAGALGQAVISICLSMNCTVFTTVSNNEKKQFLLKLFPQLKEEFIGLNADILPLCGEVVRHTEDLRCNYVISCATGDIRQDVVNFVGGFGDFMNVNNHDEIENLNFGLHFYDRSRSVKSIKLSSIFLPEYYHQKKIIHRLISEGIAQGVVRPITRVVYSPTKISTAFRILLSSKRAGRVLINMEDYVDRQNINIISRVSFRPEASYLVIGCESRLGVELADWLVKRGAKNVVLHQKNNSLDSYVRAKKELWKKNEVFSKQSKSNLQNYEECESLLAECEMLGPVLGIFVLNDAALNRKEKESVISNIDKASQSKCHLLSHFVIVSDYKHIGSDDIETAERICEIRNENLLPGLIIHTDAVNEKNGETIAERSSKLFNTLESCIQYRYNKVITHDCKTNDKEVFMREIYRILRAFGDDTLDGNTCLRSLNVNEFCLDEIRNLINKTYEVDYSKDELQCFTLDRFRNLSGQSKEDNKIEGFRVFYNFVDDDEIQAAEPIVKMPSKVGSCKSLALNELDSKASHLIMIPGFEGHSRIFSLVGEMLKIEAVSLQLSPDLEGNSIPEMANVLFKQIKKCFEFESKFYIMGYSFGVNIALELAALLEKEGHLGIVYCLDSSPDAVRFHLETYLGNLSDTELQDVIITEIFKIITGKSSESLYEELKKEDSWPKKVEVGLMNLKQYVNYSIEYQRGIIESIYKRMKLSRDYEPNYKLQSELVLMKGSQQPGFDYLAKDYNLSKYSKNTVRVFDIETDHASAPYYSGISNIVNRMIEPELLEKYKRMNLCEIYFED